MASFADSYDLATFQPFRKRVQVAVVKLAHYVIETEVLETEHHDKREYLARLILQNADQWAGVFAMSVVTNPAITLESTDSDIEYTVNVMFNTHAGVSRIVADE